MMKRYIISLFQIVCLLFTSSVTVVFADNGCQINSSDNVHFIVIDPLERKTGYDPINKHWYEEIPGANYGSFGIDDYVSHEFITASYGNLITGPYKIKIIGNRAGKFSLWIYLEQSEKDTNFHFTGLADSGSISYLQFNYSSNPDSAIIIEYIPSFLELSVFATHSIWLKQNSEILSGSVGVNEVGEGPFLDSKVELSFGIGVQMAPGYCLKANRVKVKQNGVCESDVYTNELTGIGIVTGTQYTPLHLPLYEALPEFHTGEPGTQDIMLNQNEEFILDPGDYGDIQVKLEGKLIFTGGIYNIRNLKSGDNTQLVFRAPSELRISEKFETGQKSFIGPEDSTAMNGSDIVFYVGGINGSTGKLGATPKAAKVGLNNTVFANFYVPNGTLWLRQNSEAEGSFIGKDVVVGINVKVSLKSAW
jgi:hypothetical protein